MQTRSMAISYHPMKPVYLLAGRAVDRGNNVPETGHFSIAYE